MTGRARFRRAMVALIVCLPASALSAQSGNELFQQALTKERAEGKLQDAISLYQRILREHAKDRPLAARTLVQLGKAYERLGERDARTAYERVVREFGDQPIAVSEARDRLVALAPDGSGTSRVASARLVFRSDVLNGAVVTQDGRYLVFVDSTGNLATRDVRSGQIAQITHSSANWDEFVDRLAASPDGQVFAYAWWNGPRNVWELRSIDRRSGTERVLVSDSTIAYSRPYGFTPDGRSVLATISSDDERPSQLMLIDVQTAVRTPLKSIRGAEPVKGAVSPDGKFVVYDQIADTIARTRDIRILTISTKADTLLIQHPADDFGPMWGPRGEGVLFVSTRGGSPAGWYVPTREGKATDSPTQVRADPASASRLELTRDAVLYYVPSSAARMDVYLAEINPATGDIVKAPAMLDTKTTGSNTAPSWSRDGKFLVYVAGSAQPGIRLRSIETGAETEFRVSATRVDITADNRFIIGAFLDRVRSKVGLLRIDVKSGAVDTIVQRPSSFAMNNPVSSADGGSIYYSLHEKGRGRIVERNLQSGAERDVDASGTLGMIALSPDGHWIATLVEQRVAGRPTQRVKLVPLSRQFGTVRELALLDHVGASTLSWMPDGKSVVALASDGSKKELWLVPVDGSSARRLTRSFGKDVMRAQLSPDGRHVALRIDDHTSELWAAQNFLPTSQRATKK